MRSAKAEWLTRDSTGDQIDLTLEGSEIDFVDAPFNQWPWFPMSSGRGFIRGVVDRSIGTEAGACALIALIQQQVEETSLMQSHGQTATA